MVHRTLITHTNTTYTTNTTQSHIATIGFFDGVHLGHRYVLAQLCQEAHERGLRPLVITFRQHPSKILSTSYTPLLLNTYAERITRLHEVLHSLPFGADAEVETLDFSEICHLTAQAFMSYLREYYSVQIILMGYDHRFGSDCLSDRQNYLDAGKQAGVEILALPQYRPQVSFAEDGLPQHVSSTDIRTLLQAGRIEEANELLGYPYAVQGVVVHGKGLGHQLGFPTANLSLADPFKLLPLAGVYTGVVRLDAEQYPALINIGTNPTVGNTQQTVEVHIPMFNRDIYSTEITVLFATRLRDERKFASLEALRTQIQHDLSSLTK